MANKTATLKNQAGDNIYPNIVGDNRNAAIKDSTTIKHTLAENKISLDLDETIKGKIDAALQKPTGLTKTKLIGVGASGQENIEIGDNLTLANGKLSATGGGSGGDFEIVTLSDDMSTYTGTITGTKAVLIKLGTLELIPTNINEENGIIHCSVVQSNMVLNLEFDNGNFNMTTDSISKSLWNHFITITSYKDGSADGYAYFNFYDTNNQKIDTISSLFTRIQNKSVMGSGYLHGKYIVFMSTLDSNVIATFLESGSVQSSIIIDSTFGILDKVSKVE